MLSAENVAMQINEKILLSDINIQIQPGKLYGLIGHNGSGKSTLIKLLAGEHKPTSGNILLGGTDINSMSNKSVAKKIAYLPQKLADAQSFTVAELVMLGRYPWQKWLQKPSNDDKQIVQRAMQQTQIDNKAHQSVATLSGGERSRAWLAMCLAQQTDFLLLDETLAPLDIVYQIEVLNLIRDLVTQNNLGIVLIVHDINLAAKYCDEIIAIKQGQVCHVGDIESTMKKEKLHDIFGVDLQLIQHPSDIHKVALL